MMILRKVRIHFLHQLHMLLWYRFEHDLPSSKLIAARIYAIVSGIFKHTQELLRGYMAEATPKKSRVTIFGQMNAAGSIGFIVGPPIGGHMAELPGGFYIISMLSAGLFFLNFGRLIHALFYLSIR